MIRINLAPAEARRRMPSMSLSVPTFNLGVLFGILYFVAVAGLGLYWYGLASEESTLTADIDRLNRELASLKTTLDSFIDTVPRDLWITGLEQKESVLKLNGTAFSTTAVSDFMSNLKSSGKFKDVDIVISRQAIDKTPSLVSFEVTCRIEI
jgi:Tfp pilus assembly protein PilN